MLSFKEFEQITVALQTMTAPVKHGDLILVPRDYVLKLLNTFVVEVE